MRERTKKLAEKCGIYDRLRSLEDDILAIDRVVDVDFSIDSFFNNWDIQQVILIVKYDIPATLEFNAYFDARQKNLQDIFDVCAKYDLHPSGDRIEDMGEHWYIVRSTKSWK